MLGEAAGVDPWVGVEDAVDESLLLIADVSWVLTLALVRFEGVV